MTQHFSNSRFFVTIYISWWLFCSILQTVVLHRLDTTWQVASIDAVISNTLLALAGFIIIMTYRFYQPGKNNQIYHFIYGTTIAFLICYAITGTLSIIFKSDENYLHFIQKSIPVRFIFSLLIMYFIIILSWLLNNLLDQKAIEKRKNDSERLLKETELVKLRQQLQPHFLFNSLNSISALIILKPTEARIMIQQLSDFLRSTLKSDNQLINLNEELQHLKLYLDIEKVRFGHRLSIEFNTNEESLSCNLPALLLQPIIENAIKFGLYDTIDVMKVSIQSYKEINHLIIKVTNPFDASSSSSTTTKGEGFGLSSIKRRLFLLYAQPDLLTTEINENIFTTVLKIPMYD
ncbi:MAG: histidine kinase [Bacteroidia bacterium]